MRWGALVVLCVACGPMANAPVGGVHPVYVFAAASLTEAFKALPAHDSLAWIYNFAGSPTLVTQIENGAQADVFASADTANMDRLEKDGMLAEPPRVFAHNKLEIVVAVGNPKGIHSLADLTRSDIIYISAAPTVPAGKYASQILARAGVTASWGRPTPASCMSPTSRRPASRCRASSFRTARTSWRRIPPPF